MVRQKNMGLKESVLLLAFFFCVGFAGGAEAIELAFPVSIYEILPSEQVERVKASNALKAVQQGSARKAIKKQAGANIPAMQKMMAMRLGRVMSSRLSAQVEKQATLKSKKLDSESTVQTTPSSEGY